jgi:DNA polymerase-3 subunit gamma/tau
MSYIVLARKWRPKRFADMVGQEHVLRALTNSLDSGKIHHAFLFTGTRGVGKTTIARILAKSLNCERGVSSNPCGVCAACREIDEGRFVDLIEVDAASRTKVDDTRELLDNVQYAPSCGRYKVYLIDEVHMLSNHSFNALLKTLEEPPPHVKFLLATTDPQKLPVTVLSRCLQFSLKRLSSSLIAERMKLIATAEKLDFEPAALAHLARAADGSMRDGLSLLDQLIAFGGGALSEANTRAMLGTIDRGHVSRIVEALAREDGPGLLAQVAELDRDAPDYDRALADLAAFLQRIAIVQIVPDAAQEDEEFDAEVLARMSRSMRAEDVQLYYQIALAGRRDLSLAPDPRLGFEMTLLRMLAFRPAGAELVTPAAGGAARAAPARPQAEAAGSGTVLKGAAAAPATGAADSPWAQIVSRLELAGAARQLAHHCVFIARQGAVVRLALDPRNQLVRTPAQEEKLAQALSRYYGETVRLEFQAGGGGAETPAQAQRRGSEEEQAAARRAFEDEAGVQGLRERFGATVLPDTVRPVK